MQSSRDRSVVLGSLLVVLGLAGLLMGPSARADFFDVLKGWFAPVPPAPTRTSDQPLVTDSLRSHPELYKPVEDYEAAVVHAVERASPSVVSIVVTKDLPVIERCPYDPYSGLPPEFREFFGFGGGFTMPCERGTKKQEVGGGSGFVVSGDGLVVTNKHVVNDEKAAYTVLANDGKKYDAKVLARDISLDLAILKIEAGDLLPVVLGDSDSVKLGQTAIAIGNSLGEFRNTVSVGVVSGLSRTITASGASYGDEVLQGLIQTDAAINPGNSGGPLLNLKGEVIGINTAVASGAENIGFTIPINQAKRAIESVKKSGRIITPYLGVRYLMLNEEVAKKQKVSVQEGALIRGTEEGPGVLPGSPAERAGFKAEDIIVAVGGVKVSEGKPLGALIQEHAVGDSVSFTVRRGGETLTLTVTLAERPSGE